MLFFHERRDACRQILQQGANPAALRLYDALESGAEEVLGDDITRQVKQGLSAQPAVYLSEVKR